MYEEGGLPEIREKPQRNTPLFPRVLGSGGVRGRSRDSKGDWVRRKKENKKILKELEV